MNTIRSIVFTLTAMLAGSMLPAQAAAPRFEVMFPATTLADAVTGRLFLMISRVNEPEVRLQSVWVNGPQLLGVDVNRVRPGETMVLDGAAAGFPFRSLEELPAGDYYVQSVLNVYTEFHRADGHVIWTHMDQWEGQHFNRSPGNLYSKVVKLHLDPAVPSVQRLVLSEIIPPVQVPADTQWVRYIKIRSERLSRFWGHSIYLGAVVLLPRDYAANPQVRYPAIYYQPGHFSLEPPFGFRTDRATEERAIREERESSGNETGYEFYQAWQSEGFPRMIAVSLLHPTPFGDMSGLVNSVNNGPYEDAVMNELIPHLEKQFRILPEAHARVLLGKASGGRDALNLQLRRPEFFGGAWVFYPWAFDFKRYFILNVYENDNAFTIGNDELPVWARSPSNWLTFERHLPRARDGKALFTMRQLSQHDAVMASHAGGEFGTDDAILGPIGVDGYPRPLWDRATGRIDREVAEYWRAGDLARFAEENWQRIGPHLTGKLHFYAGDMDHWDRNYGVRAFQEFLESTSNPHVAGAFTYGPLKGDFQPMTNAGLVRMMADHVAAHAPRGELTIYFIDVEGGQSTLVVTPDHHSLLIDTGWAGDGTGFHPGDPRTARDANRILAVARDAGITSIDYLLITHFHGDHDGGVNELSQLMPIETFIDGGSPSPDALAASPETRAAFEAYEAVRSRGKHLQPRPGERLPLEDVEAIVISSAGATLKSALPGAGASNPACGDHPVPPADVFENPRSVGFVLRYGEFRFLDLGDLSGRPLFDLVCPRDTVGAVDAYLVAHHGGADVADPATFAAFRPRVAIMNNGWEKGGARATYETLQQVSGLEDVWQLHYSKAAGDQNFAATRVANLDESTAHWIKLVARDDGSFRVFNPRTAKWKSYAPRHGAGTSQGFTNR